MQRVQRKFGGFLPRTADETQVATLLKDFKEADQMLAKIIEGAKAWREAWSDILRHQLFLATEYETLYEPILGAMKDHEPSHVPVETPQDQLDRVRKLRAVYAELKNDMEEEVNTMDVRLIRTAKEAREALAPMHKVIKRREDRKLDYERYKSRVEHVEKKDKRSDRDNTALAKHQVGFEHATQEYQSADSHLRKVLPSIINATFALLPHLLATQIRIQNAILAQFYTLLHNYCDECGFPSPPPEWDDVVSTWDGTFTPFRKELEGSFALIAHGKAVHSPMEQQESNKGSSITGFGIRNGLAGRLPGHKGLGKPPPPPASRRTSGSSAIASPPAVQSSPALHNGPAPAVDASSKPRIGSPNSIRPRVGCPPAKQPPYDASPAVTSPSLATSPVVGAQRSTSDYFGAGTTRPRIPSSASHSSQNLERTSSADSPGYVRTPIVSAQFPNALTRSITTPASPSSNGSSPGISKKKAPPPPPPKPKRINSQQVDFVTAMYDFEGQNQGDLSFKEGDKIRVIKRTDSIQDWWEGEVRGLRGSFPANYCQT